MVNSSLGTLWTLWGCMSHIYRFEFYLWRPPLVGFEASRLSAANWILTLVGFSGSFRKVGCLFWFNHPFRCQMLWLPFGVFPNVCRPPSLQDHNIQMQLHSNMCFATFMASFGGISFPLRRTSALRRLQFVDSGFRGIELQLCRKHWVFDHYA